MPTASGEWKDPCPSCSRPHQHRSTPRPDDHGRGMRPPRLCHRTTHGGSLAPLHLFQHIDQRRYKQRVMGTLWPQLGPPLVLWIFRFVWSLSLCRRSRGGSSERSRRARDSVDRHHDETPTRPDPVTTGQALRERRRRLLGATCQLDHGSLRGTRSVGKPTSAGWMMEDPT